MFVDDIREMFSKPLLLEYDFVIAGSYHGDGGIFV